MVEFWQALADNLDATLMIFARVTGIFSFNPLLARSNVPARVRAGLSLLITYILVMTMSVGELDIGDTAGSYVMCIVRELLIGVVIGFVCDLFIYMLYFAGDIMDSQAGLGMAKIFDPSSNIQMSMYGSYSGYMFYLYFFVSNAHLTFIQLFVDSFDALPLCTGVPNFRIGTAIMDMYSNLLILMVQLAMPVVAVELIVEFCVGVLMKAVPQIQIMAVNIQLKVACGFILLLAITPSLSDFIKDYIDKLIGTCREVLPLIINI